MSRDIIDKYLLEVWAYWSNLFDKYLDINDGGFYARLANERQRYLRSSTQSELFRRALEIKWKEFEQS